MKNLIALILFAFAPFAWDTLRNASLPAITGVAIMLFSSLFIFTVMSAHSPVQWKLSIRIPKPVGILKDLIDLTMVIILFAATAAILIALADTGPGHSFGQALINVIKCLPRLIDV